MLQLSNIINYFHDCYRSDNRELVIYDFLDRKVENRILIEEKEELINGDYPIIPIDSDKAQVLLKKIEVFQKEKELLYGCFFVCGQYTDFKGQAKRLCSPLFYYPASITYKDEFYYLSLKTQERRINYPLLSLLAKDSNSDILQDPIFKSFPKDYIGFGDINKIVSLCKKYFPDLIFENVYSFPQNYNLRKIKKEISVLEKKKYANTTLLPTSMVGLVAKSTNTRGVLNELKDLSKSTNLSRPIQSLFIDNKLDNKSKPYQKGYTPSILSHAQQSLVESSAVNPTTLIVGPPGTGKSYSIGAIAIEHMSRGESVLIASRTDEAVDVILSKIKSQIGTDKFLVRGGKKRSYTTPLNRYLKALLTRVHPFNYLIKELRLSKKINKDKLEKGIQLIEEIVVKQRKEISHLENVFKKEVDNEIKWGKQLSKSNSSILNKLKSQYLDIRNRIQTPIWETSNRLNKEDKNHHKTITDLILLRYTSQVLHALNHNWNDIKKFSEAIKISSDTERIKKFKEIDFNIVLKTFPIWLTNLSDVKNFVPFKKELFDVAIIDEATQCDIASCLPILQRAKRVVFAGDPNQLRHVSFLSKDIQSLFKDKYNLQQIDSFLLNYRDNSILDLSINALQSKNQVAMLDEHFRSIPPIIAFSNKHFYDNELHVMTSKPDATEQGLYIIPCQGIREKNGTNPIECEQLIDDIKHLVSNEKETTITTTIGILSPFRNQVDLLAKTVIETFEIEIINKHQIRVGTAYSFQGEERDNMFLSFAVDSDTHHSAFNHINKSDVFNVSITRARNKQYVYTSVSESDLKAESLFNSYLSETKKELKKIHQPTESHDIFLKEIIIQLEKWKITSFWTGFSIAGLEIDILVKLNGRYIGIDLIGYPGKFQEAFGVERNRILNRAGIHIFPLPYSDWNFEKPNTQKALFDFLEYKL